MCKLSGCIGEQLENHCNLNICANIEVAEDLIFFVHVSLSISIFRVDEIRWVLLGIPSARCLVKISELQAAFVDTDETTFTLCSLMQFNYTA